MAGGRQHKQQAAAQPAAAAPHCHRMRLLLPTYLPTYWAHVRAVALPPHLLRGVPVRLLGHRHKSRPHHMCRVQGPYSLTDQRIRMTRCVQQGAYFDKSAKEFYIWHCTLVLAISSSTRAKNTALRVIFSFLLITCELFRQTLVADQTAFHNVHAHLSRDQLISDQMLWSLLRCHASAHCCRPSLLKLWQQ